MKRLHLLIICLGAMLLGPAEGLAQEGGDEWNEIGTGSYQPGILDCYEDEFPDVMSATVYESKTTAGKYKFIPLPPVDGVKVVTEIIVHAENPDKVWCEDASFFWGIVNLHTIHKVKEAGSGDIAANYGTLRDGVIAFKTKESFVVSSMTGPVPTNLKGNFALVLPGYQVPGADPIVYDTWEVMGTGKYTEGFVDCEYEPGRTWNVEIEKSVEHPGCYRFKPYPKGNPSCPNLPEIANAYLYVHAENPAGVYTSDLTLLNNQGKGYKIHHRATDTEVDGYYEYYGVLENNIITFPANSHIAAIIGIPGTSATYTNEAGKATIALPGADYGDYYVKAVHSTCAISTKDGFCRFPLRIEGGADVAGAGVVVEAGYIAPDKVDIDKYIRQGVQSYPKEFFNFDMNMNFPMVADQFGTNRWTMILIALDSAGKPHGYSLSTYFTPEEDDKWETCYKAEMHDILLSPAYFTGESYEVVVERNKEARGRYRVVAPYNNHPLVRENEEYIKGHTEHPHYLYINAEDPEYVYIEESPMGLDLGYGDVVASSPVGTLLNQGKKIDEIKTAGTPAGRMNDNEFSFPKNSLNFFETSFKNMTLQDCGNGLLLRLTEPYSDGIEEIRTENVENVEYYDLQGIRVNTPRKGGLYIRRANGKSSKIIF